MSQPTTDPTESSASAAAAYFAVTAAASPGVMPRVLELFAKRGLVPTEWHARTDGMLLSIEIRMLGMEPRLAAYIGACLRQIHFVDRVLVIPENPPRDTA